MDNDNKPNLRVVGNSRELNERQREMIDMLREAISQVEHGGVESLALTLAMKEGDILNMASACDQLHNMVAATVYQLFDLVNANAKAIK